MVFAPAWAFHWISCLNLKWKSWWPRFFYIFRLVRKISLLFCFPQLQRWADAFTNQPYLCILLRILPKVINPENWVLIWSIVVKSPSSCLKNNIWILLHLSSVGSLLLWQCSIMLFCVDLPTCTSACCFYASTQLPCFLKFL